MRCLSLSVLLLGALILGSLRPGSLARAEEESPVALLPKDRPMAAVIDHYIHQPIAEQGVTPAPLADDATLLPRLTLDLNGRFPTTAEYAKQVASIHRVAVWSRWGSGGTGKGI